MVLTPCVGWAGQVQGRMAMERVASSSVSQQPREGTGIHRASRPYLYLLGLQMP